MIPPEFDKVIEEIAQQSLERQRAMLSQRAIGPHLFYGREVFEAAKDAARRSVEAWREAHPEPKWVDDENEMRHLEALGWHDVTIGMDGMLMCPPTPPSLPPEDGS